MHRKGLARWGLLKWSVDFNECTSVPAIAVSCRMAPCFRKSVFCLFLSSFSSPQELLIFPASSLPPARCPVVDVIPYEAFSDQLPTLSSMLVDVV